MKIQNYDAFPADMQTRFRIDGGKILLEHINLQSAGASTAVTGYVDMKNWPDMLYNVKSRIDFPIQKGIFFKGMNFTVAGPATSRARSASSRRRPAPGAS